MSDSYNENDGGVSGTHVCPHCNDAHLDSAGPSTSSVSTFTRTPNEATDINTDEDNDAERQRQLIDPWVQRLLGRRESQVDAMLQNSAGFIDFTDDTDTTDLTDFTDSADSGVAPLPQEKIEEISTMAVGADDIDRDAKCTICQEDCRGFVAVSRLPCKHIYHAHCLEKWLHYHGTCPICRLNLNDKEEQNNNSDNSASVLNSVPSESQSQSFRIDENADETE